MTPPTVRATRLDYPLEWYEENVQQFYYADLNGLTELHEIEDTVRLACLFRARDDVRSAALTPEFEAERGTYEDFVSTLMQYCSLTREQIDAIYAEAHAEAMATWKSMCLESY